MTILSLRLPLTEEQMSALHEIARSRRSSIEAVIASAIGTIISPIILKRRKENEAALDRYALEMRDVVEIPTETLRYFDAVFLRHLAGLPPAPQE
jgi:hypothetical protein